MNGQFEIVRTDADQPWHARTVASGRKGFRTENLSRKVGAERALIGLAKMFGWHDPVLVHGHTGSYLADQHPAGPLPVTVVYVDERAA